MRSLRGRCTRLDTRREGGAAQELGWVMITLLHAVLAFVLAANAVVAFAAIGKIEEPSEGRPGPALEPVRQITPPPRRQPASAPGHIRRTN